MKAFAICPSLRLAVQVVCAKKEKEKEKEKLLLVAVDNLTLFTANVIGLKILKGC
jgi:hypothetical protein